KHIVPVTNRKPHLCEDIAQSSDQFVTPRLVEQRIEKQNDDTLPHGITGDRAMTFRIALLSDDGMKSPVEPKPLGRQLFHQRIKEKRHVLVDAEENELPKAAIALCRGEIENLDVRFLRPAYGGTVEHAFGETRQRLNRKPVQIFGRCTAVKCAAETRELRRPGLQQRASRRDAC